MIKSTKIYWLIDSVVQIHPHCFLELTYNVRVTELMLNRTLYLNIEQT